MLVYSVIQVVMPGHNTSYPTGVNWVESRDHRIDAERRAETYNEARSGQCIGVRYDVTGPHDETIPLHPKDKVTCPRNHPKRPKMPAFTPLPLWYLLPPS